MKKMKYILNGFLALAMILLFAQCSNNQSTPSQTATPTAVGGSTNMKIAYVEIDSLLTKYRFWNDLNELMIQKEENIRTTLNEKAKELDREMREFQRKLENNGFATRERAEQETCVCHRNSVTCSSCRKNWLPTCRLRTRRTACSCVTLSTLS